MTALTKNSEPRVKYFVDSKDLYKWEISVKYFILLVCRMIPTLQNKMIHSCLRKI